MSGPVRSSCSLLKKAQEVSMKKKKAMMVTWSDKDELIEENFEEDVNLCLMANLSKVIDYYFNGECEDIDV